MPTPEPVETKRTQEVNRAKREAQEAASDLAWLMSDKRGRRFMWRLLAETGIYRQSHVPGDTHATAFGEGVRKVGLTLTSQLLQACPDRMSEMQKEIQNHVRPDTNG